ncbi:Transcriptional activator protein CzcR [Pirellula sp. SH-Sr6A]|uniref:response regulator n=1 Tax=Pirellula sp. SH-Sr6A TaxID=1632865 RepID=UPI00078CADC5|nr:response regulator [Pirellula sp. SH-Sr6A]AMV34976.1 Transcriptional activator protein CzcR [Pirellula sp. SH-Sr6A]
MKALVVEDDPTIVEMVEDVLFSLGHEFEVATNQQDAKQLLQSTDFEYVLLDLQIPAKANRGGADKQYGINCLKDIKRMKAPSPPPVIMMTSHVVDYANLSGELQRNGVRECITKPFSDATRPLSAVIEGVLESASDRTKPAERSKPKRAGAVREQSAIETTRFTGGELVFELDRVTLCGQTVFHYTRSKQITQILEAINERTRAGTWVAKSGPELASAIGSTTGQNSITCSIRAFRESAADILQSQLGLICEKQDIIRSGGPGYRFHEWITVRDKRNEEQEEDNHEDSPLNRRNRILELLRDGAKLRSNSIASELGCSLKTVKRELDALRLAGRIEFIGPNKTGTYQLVDD